VTDIKQLRKDIFDNSHIERSKESAREYFRISGIQLSNLTARDFDKLKEFVTIEINKLLADPSYRMIPELRVSKIKENKSGIFLRISGSYFSDREGISFNLWKPLFIGFCAEMSGCNQTPFIKGFVKFVDYLRGIQTKTKGAG